MNDPMYNIKVSLTTTEYVYITENGNNSLEIDLLIKNIPVCVVEAYLPLMEITPEFKDFICETLNTEYNVVEVNSNLRTIFIGENSEIEETGLVCYQHFADTPRTNAFFKRWDETHFMLFDFVLKRIDKQGIDRGIVTCLRGFWYENAWAKLETVDKPSFMVTEAPL